VSHEEVASHDLPVRELPSRQFWHQGPVRREVVELLASPTYSARFHVAGGDAVWNASSSEQGAWAELFRHFTAEGVDPFEVRRRVARIRVNGLRVLDLTTEEARRAAGVTLEELASDDYTTCQRVAALARERGLDGVLSPSAALAGAATLALFDVAVLKIVVERSTVKAPPPRMADLLASIRLRRDVSDAVRAFLRFAGTMGSEAVRRRR
jgi:RES domain-containing protein